MGGNAFLPTSRPALAETTWMSGLTGRLTRKVEISRGRAGTCSHNCYPPLEQEGRVSLMAEEWGSGQEERMGEQKQPGSDGTGDGGWRDLLIQ